jgi:hypothetical protein
MDNINTWHNVQLAPLDATPWGQGGKSGVQENNRTPALQRRTGVRFLKPWG